MISYYKIINNFNMDKLINNLFNNLFNNNCCNSDNKKKVLNIIKKDNKEIYLSKEPNIKVHSKEENNKKNELNHLMIIKNLHNERNKSRMYIY